MVVPERPNERWSLDFVSDAFTLGVVDDYARECLALIADTSLSGLRVVRELDAIIARRGQPSTIVRDNGTELTSMAVLRWCQETAVDWHYIAPGKPMQNGFVESFNGTSVSMTRCSRRSMRPTVPSPHGRRITTTTDHTRPWATCRRPSSQ